MGIWIRTWSGVEFDLENPDPCMVDIEDIAISLSHIIRFNGQTGVPYTVAEHSMYVSAACSDENKMWGLLHDAHEAYVGDIITPVKRLIPGVGDLATGIQEAINKKFNLSFPVPMDVQIADARMLATEQQAFFGLGADKLEAKPYPGMRLVVRENFRQVRKDFLYVYRKLRG